MYKNSNLGKLYLFRHGETFATRDGVSYGSQVLTAPILDDGRYVVHEMGKYLKDKEVDYFVSSEILRCRQTSGIVSDEINKLFETNSLLNEYHNETFEELRSRIIKFIEALGSHIGENILICTHGACLSAFKNLWLHGKYELHDLMDFPRPGVIWEVESGTLHEVNFN